MCFQLFLRLAYLYYESKDNRSKNKKKIPSKKNENQEVDFYDEIIAFFQDIKFLSMTEEDSFNTA